jgi:hypothetical protein
MPTPPVVLPQSAPVVAASSGGAAAKLVALVVVLGGVGAMFAVSGDSTPPAISDKVSETARPLMKTSVQAPPSASVASGTAPATHANPAARAITSTTPTPSDTASEVTEIAAKPAQGPSGQISAAPDKAAQRPAPKPSESALIRDARQALASGQTGAAARHLEQHRRHHPRGLLAEERELLSLRLAVATGRGAEARRLRDRFFATWPRSIHRHAIETLVSP